MNFNLNVAMNNGNANKYLANKINGLSNSQLMNNVNNCNSNNQQLSIAPRFCAAPNSGQLNGNSYNSISPPLNSSQLKNNNNINFSSNGLRNLPQNNVCEFVHLQQRSNFQMSTNNNNINNNNNNNSNNGNGTGGYPLNLNQYNNLNTAMNGNNVQQLNNPSLIASVIAANTTCSLNNTLFVGNLHASLQEIDLVQVFRPFGRIVECCKKWLHFGFVKFTSEEEACHAYVTLNGFRLKGRPMRLEFQNRTKKARIKAMLAQAALQSSANNMVCNNDLLEPNLNFPSFFNEERQQSAFQAVQPNSSIRLNEPKQTLNDCSFFDSDQLIKFANSLELDFDSKSAKAKTDLIGSFDQKETLNLFASSFSFGFGENKSNEIKEIVIDTVQLNSQDENFLCINTNSNNNSNNKNSPSESPHHEFSCSLSSSDSGCRSTSFLVDEDSGIGSIQSKLSEISNGKTEKPKSSVTTGCVLKSSEQREQNKKEKKNLNLSQDEVDADDEEEEEDEEENDDNDDGQTNSDTDSDTSDDASEIPADSDCLNDLELDDNFELSEELECEEVQNFNQIVDKDGSIVRKKIEFGIYRSINHTLSLFIEPQDILKKMDSDEYEQYLLFPNGVDTVADSYFQFQNRLCIFE